MNAKDFFNRVSLLREAQREYFRTRRRAALARAQKIEREIDAEIERVNKITGKPKYVQTTIFGDNGKGGV